MTNDFPNGGGQSAVFIVIYSVRNVRRSRNSSLFHPVPPPRDHSCLHVTALLPPASLFFSIRQHPPPSIRLSSFASLASASIPSLGERNPRKR
ncbi:hypothetical protein NPIL_299021 [Nephila pilipes]|uniref:Uncharacterized protein n=1 Tax=Nephila pilipes TaxID=299642 RepID=A0A8X6MNL9_NEPPI|nr:hypothetical protein NPIL_299021 [Nephila pilipes]